MTSQSNYNYVWSQTPAPIHTFVRGTEINDTATDLSCDWLKLIPMTRMIVKINHTTSIDYNEKRPCAIQVKEVALSTTCVESLWLNGRLPAIYARNTLDAVAYDDHPVFRQFRNIDVKIGPNTLETINYEMFVFRMREYFDKSYKYWTQKYFGGSREFDGEYQKKSFAKNLTSFNQIDYTKNIIIPQLEWYLPVPSSIFFNNEKFKIKLAEYSILEFNLHFQGQRHYTDRTKDVQFEEVAGSLDAYLSVITVSDSYVFNNLSYFEPGRHQYYFIDDYIDEVSKKISVNTELKLAINPCITTEHNLYIHDTMFSSSGTFFGPTVKDAVRTYLACFFQLSVGADNEQGVSPVGTFNFKTGKFINGDTKYTLWEIIEWTPGCKAFKLKYIYNTTKTFFVEFLCDVPFDSFGDLYFDLTTFDSINRSPSAPQLWYISKLRLKIDLWNPTIYSAYQERTITKNGANKIINGMFTFNFDSTAVPPDNKHVFWDIVDIEKSKYVNEEGFLAAFSQPVRVQGLRATIFAIKDLWEIHRPSWKYYDLDGKCPFEVEEIIYERDSGTGQLKLTRDLLILSQEVTREPLYTDPTLIIPYSWRVNKWGYMDTKGYINTQRYGAKSFQVKLVPLKIMFDGQEISDYWVTRTQDANPQQLLLLFHQKARRIMKYHSSGHLVFVSDNEVLTLNEQIKDYLQQQLKDTGHSVYDPEKDVTQKMLQAVNSSNEVDLPVKRARLNNSSLRDFNSMNNSRLKPLGAPLYYDDFIR